MIGKKFYSKKKQLKENKSQIKNSNPDFVQNMRKTLNWNKKGIFKKYLIKKAEKLKTN